MCSAFSTCRGPLSNVLSPRWTLARHHQQFQQALAYARYQQSFIFEALHKCCPRYVETVDRHLNVCDELSRRWIGVSVTNLESSPSPWYLRKKKLGGSIGFMRRSPSPATFAAPFYVDCVACSNIGMSISTTQYSRSQHRQNCPPLVDDPLFLGVSKVKLRLLKKINKNISNDLMIWSSPLLLPFRLHQPQLNPVRANCGRTTLHYR